MKKITKTLAALAALTLIAGAFASCSSEETNWEKLPNVVSFSASNLKAVTYKEDTKIDTLTTLIPGEGTLKAETKDVTCSGRAYTLRFGLKSKNNTVGTAKTTLDDVKTAGCIQFKPVDGCKYYIDYACSSKVAKAARKIHIAQLQADGTTLKDVKVIDVAENDTNGFSDEFSFKGKEQTIYIYTSGGEMKIYGIGMIK